MAGTNLRSRDGLPFNFVNGLKVRGVDIEDLLPGIEGIPEAGTKYQFAGNGSNTIFTLPVTPYNKDAIEVHVKQLYVHSNDYTLVGDVVTLNEAPPALDAKPIKLIFPSAILLATTNKIKNSKLKSKL